MNECHGRVTGHGWVTAGSRLKTQNSPANIGPPRQVPKQPNRRPHPPHVTLPRQLGTDFHNPPREAELVPGLNHPRGVELLLHVGFFAVFVEGPVGSFAIAGFYCEVAGGG